MHGFRELRINYAEWCGLQTVLQQLYQQVVLEPRVSPEHTSKYVDTVTVLQKLQPKVIDR